MIGQERQQHQSRVTWNKYSPLPEICAVVDVEYAEDELEEADLQEDLEEGSCYLELLKRIYCIRGGSQGKEPLKASPPSFL